jgi:hypothetical protein
MDVNGFSKNAEEYWIKEQWELLKKESDARIQTNLSMIFSRLFN